MLYAVMIVSAVIATVMVFIWLMLYLRYGKKYSDVLAEAPGKIFTLKDLYFLGLGLIEYQERVKRRRITENEKAVMEIKNLGEVFGQSKAELYFYIESSALISLILTFVPLGLLLGCLMKSWLGFGLGLVLAVMLPYGVRASIKGAIERKKDEIVSEFPKMVSKLTMLINAGMLLRKAWDEVADSNHENQLYEEMRQTTKDIQDGMTIEAAMNEFSNRCGVKEIRKFSSIYVQGIKRGAAEAVKSMRIMADEAWENKRQTALQRGEAAATKLLIPNMFMFLGIIIVVVVPMVAQMVGGIGSF